MVGTAYYDHARYFFGVQCDDACIHFARLDETQRIACRVGGSANDGTQIIKFCGMAAPAAVHAKACDAIDAVQEGTSIIAPRDGAYQLSTSRNMSEHAVDPDDRRACKTWQQSALLYTIQTEEQSEQEACFATLHVREEPREDSRRTVRM